MVLTFFEFQFKGGILLAISVLIYILFFSKDSFFYRNRAYLLSSLFIPWIIPLIAMPVWVRNLLFGLPDNLESTVIPIVIAYTNQLPAIISAESSFSWELAGLYLYGFISFILLIRFLWAYNYIRRLKQQSILKSYKGLEVAFVQDKQMSPFSFFRTIFLPKGIDKNSDKSLVLEHEKAHCNQWHSIDISLAELLLIFNWWNPFAWWLRKLIAQNHDYSVDKAILKKASEPKQYQYSLINILSGENQVQLVNHFNKNLTKKRIIMMNKANTNRFAGWLKGMLVAPFIILLFLAFTNPDKTNNNTPKETPIYTSDKIDNLKPKDAIVANQENKLTKKTNVNFKIDEKEEQIKPKLAKINTEAKVQKKVKGKVYSKETQKPIEDVKIYNNYGELLATTNEKGKFSFTFIGNPNTPKEHQGEILFVKKGFQPQHYKLDMMTDKKINIQLEMEHKHEVTGFLNNQFILNNNYKYEQPLIIIDGKVSTINTMNSLNTNLIESISVFKDKTATSIYGDKGKGGVISVSLKKNPINNSENKIVSSLANVDLKDLQLFIINGKESTRAELEKIDPNSVESIEVIKGKSAIEKYGNEAKNGVLIIKLKETDNK